MFGFGMFVAPESEQSLLTLKRALPAPRGSYLLAKMIMATRFAAIVMVTLVAAAVVVGRPGLTLGQ
jgi:hypothetical protein